MSIKTFDTEIEEQSTARYRGTLKDQDGVAVPGSSLTTLTLTLYDEWTETVVNGRDLQDVLGNHNVSVGVDGVLEWLIQPADTTLVTPGRRAWHRGVFHYTWPTGAWTHSIRIPIRPARIDG
jgi:hypothetical protein